MSDDPELVTSGASTFPALILGTMARSEKDPGARVALFRYALSQGIDCFDTAPLYGFGETERLLGKAIADVPRQQIQILGKVGLCWDGGNHGQVHFNFTDQTGQQTSVRRNSQPQSVKDEVRRSLDRLATPYLDLIQIHFVDVDTPVAQSMEALLELQQQGLIRGIGVCNVTVAQAQASATALAPGNLQAIQCRYNLLQRDQSLRSWCVHNDVPMLAYSTLAEGVLSEQAGSRLDGRVSEQKAQAIGQILRETAAELNIPIVALAMAWVLSQSGIHSVIAGASTIEQLQDQLAIHQLVDQQPKLLALGERLAAFRLREAWERNLAQRILGRIVRLLKIRS